MEKHEYYMNLALKEARRAFKKNEVPVGCIIVKDDKIIARAHNTRERTQVSVHHAEIIAIQKACKKLKTWRLEGCTMYVTLEPCAMCAGATVLSRLDTVVYGAQDFKGGYAGSLNNTLDDDRLNHQVKIVKDVLKEECSSLLKDFFTRLRNRKKTIRER